MKVNPFLREKETNENISEEFSSLIYDTLGGIYNALRELNFKVKKKVK